MKFKIYFSLGAIGMVMENEVNMTIGCFPLTVGRNSRMSPTDVYFISKMIWIVPPGAEISSFEKLLKPFKIFVWICFLFVLLGAFITTRVLQCCPKNIRDFVIGRKVHDPSLNVFNIFFGGSLHRLPKGNFARFILMMFMIYCFIITNSYKGGLLKFMEKTVREPKVATTDEMISKGFNFYLFESSRAYMIGLPHIRKRAVFMTKQEYLEVLDKIIVPGFKGALFSSKTHLLYRNIHASPSRYFHHAPEVIFTDNIGIYLSKNTCLKKRFDHYINRVSAAGLVEHWTSQYIDRSFLKRREKSSAKTLKLAQLIGEFELFLAGVIVSFIAFLFEYFLKQRKESS